MNHTQQIRDGAERRDRAASTRRRRARSDRDRGAHRGDDRGGVRAIPGRRDREASRGADGRATRRERSARRSRDAGPESGRRRRAPGAPIARVRRVARRDRRPSTRIEGRGGHRATARDADVDGPFRGVARVDGRSKRVSTESRRDGTGAFYTLVPIRPRSRGERRSLRTLPGVSLRPGSPAFNPRPRRLSTPPTDAYELHPDVALNIGHSPNSGRGRASSWRSRARGRRRRGGRSAFAR